MADLAGLGGTVPPVFVVVVVSTCVAVSCAKATGAVPNAKVIIIEFNIKFFIISKITY
jgi:hypothetical protein